ncbi:hypothetical protein [Pseudomonas sp. TE3786]
MLAASGVQAAEPEAELSGAEQARYLNELKHLYLTSDERQALLAQSNELLDTYAVRAAFQVGQAERRDQVYQLSVGGSGELLIHEKTREAQGVGLAVRNQRLSVFGVDPYIKYDCPPTEQVCILKNPQDGSPWLTIRRDHQGAAELAKALSFLLRNLQKG